MTVGLFAGLLAEAFAACAAWSVASTVLQIVRVGQAFAIARRQPIRPWLS
jgi:hypothetical protein